MCHTSDKYSATCYTSYIKNKFYLLASKVEKVSWTVRGSLMLNFKDLICTEISPKSNFVEHTNFSHELVFTREYSLCNTDLIV